MPVIPCYNRLVVSSSVKVPSLYMDGDEQNLYYVILDYICDRVSYIIREGFF